MTWSKVGTYFGLGYIIFFIVIYAFHTSCIQKYDPSLKPIAVSVVDGCYTMLDTGLLPAYAPIQYFIDSLDVSPISYAPNVGESPLYFFLEGPLPRFFAFVTNIGAFYGLGMFVKKVYKTTRKII